MVINKSTEYKAKNKGKPGITESDKTMKKQQKDLKTEKFIVVVRAEIFIILLL